jgi:hypothetical protein
VVVNDGAKEHDQQDTLRSERRGALKSRLTGPTLLEMPDSRGGLNGSTQHLLEAHAQGFQQLRIVRQR